MPQNNVPLWTTDWSGVIIADPQPALGELLAERLAESLAPLKVDFATTVERTRELAAQHSRVLILATPRLTDGSLIHLARLVRADSVSAEIAVWSDTTPQLIAPGEYVAVLPRSLSVTQLEDRIKEILTKSAGQTSSVSMAEATSTRVSKLVRRAGTALSERQLDLLCLIAEGLSIKEIAQRWKLSSKSVDSLKYRLMKELDIHNRVDLARLAILEGLIDPSQI